MPFAQRLRHPLMLVALTALVLTPAVYFLGRPPATDTPVRTDAPAAPSRATAPATDVDALWNKYQSLRQSLGEHPAAAGAAPAAGNSAPDRRTAAPEAIAGPEVEPHSPREARVQKRAEAMKRVGALRDQLIAMQTGRTPPDVEKILRIMEQIDEEMRAAGMENPINMPKMRALLIAADRSRQIGEALARETARGKAADPAKIENLQAQLRALQPTLNQSASQLLLSGGARHDR